MDTLFHREALMSVAEDGDSEGCVFVRGIPEDSPPSDSSPASRCLLIDSVNWKPTVRGLKERCLREINDRELNSDVLDLFYVLCGGRVLLDETSALRTGNEYTLQCRLLGGKGGFGSLLRSFGSQISKNRNQDACRDLSGRRIRNVKAEQKIQELAGKQAEKEKQKKLLKEEKIKKLKSQLESKPKHNFNDAEYEAERSRIPDKVFSAVEEGMTVISSKTIVTREDGTETATETIQTETVITRSDDQQPSTSVTAMAVAVPNISVSKKRQHVDPLDRDPKRMKGWLGIEDSDDSSDEEAAVA